MDYPPVRSASVAAITAAALLAGCGSGGPSVVGLATSFTQAPHVPNQPLPSNAITHVVIIVQENRSFDNMFNGFPGADTAQSGQMSDGARVQLGTVGLADLNDIDHGYNSFRLAYDHGRMDAFNDETVFGYDSQHVYGPLGGMGAYPYSALQRSDVTLYWQMAQAYTLADRMFASNGGPSFPSHQYLIAGQSDDAVDAPAHGPWGCDAPPGTTVNRVNSTGATIPGPFPCFNYASLADRLNAGHQSWHYYTPPLTDDAGIYSAYDAIRQIRYSPDWSANVISPQTRVLTDVPKGILSAVTWVVPTFADSDHAGVGSKDGPSWVASIVNAIGTSKFWPHTAIFITWDEWGGWYDHVPPAQYDVMGLGFRVPLIVVSPYAKHGYVSHVQHEFGSILKFVEDDFSLPSLGTVDTRADNLTDCFDFSQQPRPFARLRAPRDASYFLRERVSRPPDND